MAGRLKKRGAGTREGTPAGPPMKGEPMTSGGGAKLSLPLMRGGKMQGGRPMPMMGAGGAKLSTPPAPQPKGEAKLKKPFQPKQGPR
jgi:hypothetical protein